MIFPENPVKGIDAAKLVQARETIKMPKLPLLSILDRSPVGRLVQTEAAIQLSGVGVSPGYDRR